MNSLSSFKKKKNSLSLLHRNVGFNKQLPDDSWDLVFKKLDSNVDRNSFGLTCHSFLDIQSSSYKSLKFGCSSRESNCSIHVNINDFVFNEHLFKRFTQLESLSLGTCLSIKDSGLTPFVKYGSKLVSLKLDSCHNVTDIGLTLVASSCPLLSNISLAGCSITDSGLDILTKLWFSPTLAVVLRSRVLWFLVPTESLSLGTCLSIKDSGLTPFVKYGSKLVSLKLDSCHNVTDIGLTLVASSCPLLSNISLAGCSITDSGLDILTKLCKSLKEVNLAWCPNITDCGILSLNQNSRQLKSLNITCCFKTVGLTFQGFSPTLACLEAAYCAFGSTGINEILSGGGLEYLNLSYLSCSKFDLRHKLAAFIGIGSAANLRFLNLCMCLFVEDSVIIAISKGCPLLQEWNLSCCHMIGISGWESIGSYCQNLEILHVGGCFQLCDRGLLALGNGCKRLSVIYMTNDGFKVTTSGLHLFKFQKEDVEIKEEILDTNISRMSNF
ncbi:hypothetical protein CTI12_AA520250 [Artemisia annua]|uniref:F-box/LRR-repeat protein 15-like leucin rich repeat domain-containing protein n=1 Tax=Artemisia annua TaxID=35608 RepID=A0A2U1L804_ARTAN|nr:hypothetical protein CTI12_AA520250 [Artemisia annua]